MRSLIWQLAFLAIVSLALQACSRDDPPISTFADATPLIIEAPKGLPPFPNNMENPLTEEGVELGRHLFYDPLLSRDFSISCASCHKQENAFSDPNTVSIGVDGALGSRQAMPIFNLAYHPETSDAMAFTGFFWDGRRGSLEEQALDPIQDPVEMHNTLPQVIERLASHEAYPLMFEAAFGTTTITTDMVANALSQFQRSIVSGNTPFDRMDKGEIFWDDDVFNGWKLFKMEAGLGGADCFHCHTAGLMFTDFTIRNNGLDSFTAFDQFSDLGLAAISGDTMHAGSFKIPTLRNIALTAPYMHDGRFTTLAEVIDFYSEGVKATPFTDQFMEQAHERGVQLDADQKAHLLAFLHALTDTALINNPAYSDPFE